MIYKIFSGWKLPLEQFLKQFCEGKTVKTIFLNQSLKSPMQEFLFHCTVFRNQFISKNWGIIWKHFLHESSCSLTVLKLSCFEKNLILYQLIPVFIWNRDKADCTSWDFGLGFWLKTWPLEPYFEKLAALVSRKNPTLQLCSFTFSQIRPLKTSNLLDQKTALFWSELDSFRF